MEANKIQVEHFCDEHSESFRAIIRKAYEEGYQKGYSHSLEEKINGVKYYDLGLPSGIMWSAPIEAWNPFTYITYELKSYCDVCDLGLPTVEDINELIKNCKVERADYMVSKDVYIIGPNGNRISIGTKDYLNRADNPNSVKCVRQGEKVEPLTNLIWLKGEVENNEATVCKVNFMYALITISKYYTGYRLPYLLVKRP